MSDQCTAGPDRTWTVGEYRFGLYRACSETHGARRWECTNTRVGRGSGGRGPVRAFVNLRRFMREPLRPMDPP